MSLHLTLTPEQTKELRTYIANPLDDLPAHRLQIVAMAGRGLTVPQIASSIALHPINVRKWLHRYEQRGLEGLKDKGKSPGRPLVFEAGLRAEIKRLYATKPRKLGLPFADWSLARMRTYLINRGLVETISIETVRQCVAVNP